MLENVSLITDSFSMKSPSRKMQSVNFKNVDEFLAYLPEDELEILELLREVILDCIPDCREKLSYNVPYFKRHRNICFIWPASVTWGKSKTYEGVKLGFVNGNLMADELNYLEKGERKQVYWRDFTSISEIDIDVLKTYIFEAVMIDEERAKK